MKLFSALIVAFLSVMPTLATANPVVKCVQRGLKEAGHNPRGIDGIIGRNTRTAATAWARKTNTELPGISTDSAPRWCAAILNATGTLPEAAPGTDRYCIWFQEVLNGVWLHPDGQPALSFRFASGPDEAGCYAWINALPAWFITEPGTQILRVERDESQRSWGTDENGIFIDTQTGLARYMQKGFTTFGVLTD